MSPAPADRLSATRAEALPERRSDRKRRAILEAATEAFLRHGFLGTSMDEIAAAAAVSKQTVYKHFSDKESLFREIVTTTVDEISDGVHVAERRAQEHFQPNGALLRYELLQRGPENAVASPLGVDDINLPGVADRTNGVRVAKAAVVVFQFAA